MQAILVMMSLLGCSMAAPAPESSSNEQMAAHANTAVQLMELYRMLGQQGFGGVPATGAVAPAEPPMLNTAPQAPFLFSQPAAPLNSDEEGVVPQVAFGAAPAAPINSDEAEGAEEEGAEAEAGPETEAGAEGAEPAAEPAAEPVAEPAAPDAAAVAVEVAPETPVMEVDIAAVPADPAGEAPAGPMVEVDVAAGPVAVEVDVPVSVDTPAAVDAAAADAVAMASAAVVAVDPSLQGAPMAVEIDTNPAPVALV